jgi:hypothetical protein
MGLVLKKSLKNFVIDKKGQELGPNTLFLLLIMFAAGTAVMLVIMGKWLDLTGIRYKMDTQRNAMNLVQLIISNSPVVSKESDQPDKVILDAKELDDYVNEAGLGSEIPSFKRMEWEDCCDFLNFDHNFTVHDIVTGKSWTIGNLVFDESICYPNRVQGIADVPVVVSQNGEKHPGVAIVRLKKTPLSDLSFWLSQAFIRAYWDDYWELFPEENSYRVMIPLHPEIEKISIHNVDKNNKRICTHVDRDIDGDVGGIDIIVCKNFVFKRTTSSGDPIDFSLDEDESLYTGECMNSMIRVVKNPKRVEIVYPVLE